MVKIQRALSKVLSGTLIIFVVLVSTPIITSAITDCPEVLTIFARGSKQIQGNLDSQPQTKSFFNELERRKPDGIEIDKKELRYPAAGGWNHYAEAEWNWARIGNYRASVEEGIKNAVELINQQVANCPDQKIVLGGYSQGAQVMGDALYRISDEVAEHIVYIGLFGDPKFRPNSYAARGDFERRAGGILEARKDEFPAKFVGKVNSWCIKYDGICENNLLLELAGASDHPTYQENAIPEAANEATILLSQYFPDFNPSLLNSTQKLPALDVVVAFNSGRFVERYARSIASGNADQWVDSLWNLSESTRLGVVDYTHPINKIGIARTVGKLTEDKFEGRSYLTKIRTGKRYPTGEGNDKQPVFSGLMEAIKHQEWRPDALKAIYYIERVLPSDPEYNYELDTSYGFEQVMEAARSNSTGPIAIYPFYTHTAPAEYLLAHKKIADATGGRMNFYYEPEYNQGYLHFRDALNKLKLEPMPITLGPYEWRPGIPMVLSVGKMGHPKGMFTRYEWDYDGDGTYEYESTGPVSIHEFENAYDDPVWVRISTSKNPAQNQYSYAKILVDISQDNVILRKPSKPELSGSTVTVNRTVNPLSILATIGYSTNNPTTQKVTLEWQPPSDDGGAAIEGYEIYGNGELLGITSAEQTSVVVANAPADAVFTIAAVNEAGVGGAAEVVKVNDAENAPPQTNSTQDHTLTGFQLSNIADSSIGIENGENAITRYRYIRGDILGTTQTNRFGTNLGRSIARGTLSLTVILAGLAVGGVAGIRSIYRHANARNRL